jgi:hypothetical protein
VTDGVHSAADECHGHVGRAHKPKCMGFIRYEAAEPSSM